MAHENHRLIDPYGNMHTYHEFMQQPHPMARLDLTQGDLAFYRVSFAWHRSQNITFKDLEYRWIRIAVKLEVHGKTNERQSFLLYTRRSEGSARPICEQALTTLKDVFRSTRYELVGDLRPIHVMTFARESIANEAKNHGHIWSDYKNLEG